MSFLNGLTASEEIILSYLRNRSKREYLQRRNYEPVYISEHDLWVILGTIFEEDENFTVITYVEALQGLSYKKVITCHPNGRTKTAHGTGTRYWNGPWAYKVTDDDVNEWKALRVSNVKKAANSAVSSNNTAFAFAGVPAGIAFDEFVTEEFDY